MKTATRIQKSIQIVSSMVLLLLAATSIATAQPGQAHGDTKAFIDELTTVVVSVAERYHYSQMPVMVGPFTYRDTELSSPFSRRLEEEIREALSGNPKLRLVARDIAGIVAPSLKSGYEKTGEIAEASSVILRGRFSEEGSAVRIYLEMIDVATTSYMATTTLFRDRTSIPPTISLRPTPQAEQMKSQLAEVYTRQPDTLKVSISPDRGRGGIYQDGEKLTALVSTNRDAYVKIYHIDVDGTARLIYPNRFESKNLLRAGTVMKFPSPDSIFAFKLGAPYGTEFIKVLASTQPFAMTEELLVDLAGSAQEALSRGAAPVVSSAIAETAEDVAGYEVIPARK